MSFNDRYVPGGKIANHSILGVFEEPSAEEYSKKPSEAFLNLNNDCLHLFFLKSTEFSPLIQHCLSCEVK